MATPAPRPPPPAVPPASESAPSSRIDARVEPEEEPPISLEERSRSSWPGPSEEDSGASLINAGGPPSTRYRLIAPRQGKRVPKP